MKKKYFLKTVLPAFVLLVVSYIIAELVTFAVYGSNRPNYIIYLVLGIFFGVLTAFILSKWVSTLTFQSYAKVILLLYIAILVIGEFLFQVSLRIRTSAILDFMFYYFPQVVAFMYMCSFPVFHLVTIYLILKWKDRARMHI